MLYVIIIALAIIIWLVAVDRPRLVVKCHDGKINQIKGHIPPSFHHNLKDILERAKASGMLKVYQTRNGAKLVFSKQLDKSTQQKIRNVFPHQGFKPKGNKKSR
ncbi:DUF3634 family protein [Vibrio hippocampi]|uniref:DUF3634 domain-containing protein n=1 Tax=Vibrio hippocampi TaxID=654686 RepID=A0ABM8ZH36_9VIBR|nr:DUF3634 family protein [Vibrio hippocampi]CAH0525992.1 hypothetical protein VHP8226_01474 [Vibrio hippocampi]